MKFNKKHAGHLLFPILLFSASFLLESCAKKAMVIQAGATQFEVESLAAIERIDELLRKETETAPLPQKKASETFVKAVKGYEDPITLETLRVLINPLRMKTPESEAQWQAFLFKMRNQYTTFTAAFASLDKGSFFAASEVKETIPILDKLIAQMAAFAQTIHEHPAEFIRERSAIAAEMEHVRDEKTSDEIKNLKLLELERRLRNVLSIEQKMTRDTIEQALKAATLGQELRILLENYEKLSLDDISEGLSISFKLVGAISGLDLSELKGQTDNLISGIKSDPKLSAFFSTALSEIIKARDNTSH